MLEKGVSTDDSKVPQRDGVGVVSNDEHVSAHFLDRVEEFEVTRVWSVEENDFQVSIDVSTIVVQVLVVFVTLLRPVVVRQCETCASAD